MNIFKIMVNKKKVYKVEFIKLKGDVATILVKAKSRGDAFEQLDRIFGRKVLVTDIGVQRD